MIYTVRAVKVNMVTLKKYYGKTCAPCLSLGRILGKVQKTREFEIETIEIEDEPMLADYANIKKIPTIIVEKNEVEVFRFSGVKSSKEIEKIIDTYS